MRKSAFFIYIALFIHISKARFFFPDRSAAICFTGNAIFDCFFEAEII